jgi:hypothetical protein
MYMCVDLFVNYTVENSRNTWTAAGYYWPSLFQQYPDGVWLVSLAGFWDTVGFDVHKCLSDLIRLAC